MEKMKQCVLLIGNGLNRNKESIQSTNPNTAWDQILEALAKNHQLNVDYSYSALSYPMNFEIIANHVMQNYGTNGENYPVKVKDRAKRNPHLYLKTCFAKKVGTFRLNTDKLKIDSKDKGSYSHIPKWVFEGKIKAILTTNYEFLIEESILNYKPYKYNENSLNEYTFISNHHITKTRNKKNEWVKVNGQYVSSILSNYAKRNHIKSNRDDKKAVLERCELLPIGEDPNTPVKDDKKIPIYHIHGDINYPAKIVLGHEHYVTICTMLSELFKKEENSIFELAQQSGIDLKNFQYGNYDTPHHVVDTWPYLFFSEDIHIIGFGLNPAEIDSWWLLTYRAMVYARNGGKKNPNNPIQNKIYLYEYVCVAFDDQGKPIQTDANYLDAKKKQAAMAYFCVEYIPFFIKSWDDNDCQDIYAEVEKNMLLDKVGTIVTTP